MPDAPPVDAMPEMQPTGLQVAGLMAREAASISRGGLDLAAFVAADRDGHPRPGDDALISIGAYETDEACVP